MLNSGLASTSEASIIASKMQIPALAIDYTKSIDAPAPASRNDIVKVWNALLKTRSADSMVMGDFCWRCSNACGDTGAQ